MRWRDVLALAALAMAVASACLRIDITTVPPPAAPTPPPQVTPRGVFRTDDFENHLYPNWVSGLSTCQFSPSNVDGCPFVSGQQPFTETLHISTEQPHGGTHSLRCVYESYNLTTNQGYAACSFIDINPQLTLPVRNIYQRLWVRYSAGFQIDPLTTKLMYQIGNVAGDLETVWYHRNGSPMLTVSVVTPPTAYCPYLGRNDTDCPWAPNLTSYNLNDAQWHCVETHQQASSGANTADAVLEQWIDNVQTMSYTNAVITGTIGGNGATGGSFPVFRLYGQFGLGTRWIDDAAVGDTRIGCGALPPTPNAPTSLQLSQLMRRTWAWLQRS